MTNKDEKEMKIEFAPGCFDNFEGSQEELDELVAEIQNMFANKSREEIEAMSKPLDEESWEELPDEVKIQLMRSYNDEEDNNDDTRKLH